MNTPAFLISATLLFWGWQTGMLWLGALLALLISPILSLCLGVWIARADKGWPIRALYGLGAGVVILLVNLGVGFSGCVSLSQMGFLK